MQCICIDLKSFYASVECVDRGLDPLNANLVVADESRTEKTICLAVTPSLKKYGIPGRARLFEVIQKVREVNEERLKKEPYHEFTDSSCLAGELDRDPSLKLDFIIAPPQMAHYMEVSTRIYEIYLRYIAPEDIHVYSIDEVFMDVTSYLRTYQCTAHELAMKLIREVLCETGITAVFALRNWTRYPIARSCGVTVRLRISGVSAEASQKSLKPRDCSQWAILQDFRSTAKIGCSRCSVSMQSC